MWWRVIASRWSSAPRRRRAACSSGPAARSNGCRASSAVRRTASASPPAASPDRSTHGSGTGTGGARRGSGRPSAAGKTVRSASWRRTTSLRARASAAASSEPRRRKAAGTCCAGSPGVRRSRNQWRSWAEESGTPTPAAPAATAGRRRSGGAAAVSPRAASTRRASAATVRDSNSAPSGSSTPSAAPTRERTWVASRLWPPKAKKSSSAPTRATPSTPSQIAASTSSVAPRGARQGPAASRRSRRARSAMAASSRFGQADPRPLRWKSAERERGRPADPVGSAGSAMGGHLLGELGRERHRPGGRQAEDAAVAVPLAPLLAILPGDRGQEVLRGAVARGGGEAQVDAGEATRERQHAQLGEHAVLDAAAEHPAAQQEALDVERRGGGGEEDGADQPIVAEAVAHRDHPALAVAGAQEGGDLRLAAADRRRVELVGALGELRHPRPLRGLRRRHLYRKLQAGEELLERQGLL